MKKLLVGMAALSIGVAAHADVKFSGSTEVQYTNLKNEDGTKDDNSENYVNWNVLNVDGNKGEGLSYHLQLKHVANWGSRVGVNPSAADGTNQANDLFYVQEAYGWAKVGENGSVTFGRSSLELNSGELVSKQAFEDSNIAFDGLKYVHDASWGRLGLSYSVSGKTTANDNVIKFRGLSYTFKNLPEMISNLELHYISARIDGTLATGVSKPNERTWLGLNLKGDVAGFDYKLDYENYKGKTTTGTASEPKSTMMDLEVGYAMPNVMDSRVYLQVHKDGGTDGDYDPLYYNKHEYAGLMDVVGWGNLTQTSLGYNFKPSAACKAGVAYHIFKETEKAGTEDAIGSEIDLFYSHNYESGLMVNAEFGIFTPKEDELGKETIQRLYVSTGFEF